ncbi:hypothetical protein [Actinoplanes xinjiangensis]|uniref:hypothetical protein n=1 Tax=Actinoplanes xinjiangensis TaxID=512350 RepID=UPI00343ADB65
MGTLRPAAIAALSSLLISSTAGPASAAVATVPPDDGPTLHGHVELAVTDISPPPTWVRPGINSLGPHFRDSSGVDRVEWWVDGMLRSTDLPYRHGLGSRRPDNAQDLGQAR